MSKCCNHPVVVCAECGTIICGECGEKEEEGKDENDNCV